MAQFPIPSWSPFADESEAIQALLHSSSLLHEEEEDEENEEHAASESCREGELFVDMSEDDWREQLADLLDRLGFMDAYEFVLRWEPCAMAAALKFAAWQRIADPGAFLRSVVCTADVGELRPFVARCMREFLRRFRRHLTPAEGRTLQAWLEYSAERCVH